MDATQPTAAVCDWCGVNPAQRPNGECDDCWHLPGHEGEGEPTLEEERLTRDFEAIRIDYALQSEREKRLREFVTQIATTQLGNSEEMMMAMVDCIEDALKLLDELGGEDSK